jgi:hypothetical protein
LWVRWALPVQSLARLVLSVFPKVKRTIFYVGLAPDETHAGLISRGR